MKTTISNLLRWGTKELNSNQIPNPAREASLLLQHTLKIDKLPILLNPVTPVDPRSVKQFEKVIYRRAKNEPFAYITGEVMFCNHKILVNKHTLIPRPETEILVEIISNYIRSLVIGHSDLAIAEIGTGSGAISIALAKNLPSLQITATDVNAQTLKVAQKNIDRLESSPLSSPVRVKGNLSSCTLSDIEDPATKNGFRVKPKMTTSKITLIKGDLLQPFENNSLDIIIANLPYVPEDIIDEIDSTVKDFEPCNAIFSGPDGLDCIEKLIKQANTKLKPKATIFLEIWPTQTIQIEKLSKKYLPNSKTIFHPDLEGTMRFAQINLLN